MSTDDLKTTVKKNLQNAGRSTEELVRAKIAEFKRRSKYFQYRVYTIAAFAMVMLLTIVVVMPSRQRNRLKAHVTAAKGDFVVGSYILLRNDSGNDWTEVRVNLNGTHETRLRELRNGQQATLQLGQFAPKKGNAPITESEVTVVWVKCSLGVEKYPVTFGGKK